MLTFKKRLLVVSVLIVGSLGLITIGFDEGEQKKQFERGPQGNIVPDEAEIKKLKEKLNEVKQGLNQAKVDSLPVDLKKNIASYLEEDKYALWKKLKLRGDQLAFRDNGENLVSVRRNEKDGSILEISIISMKTGDMVGSFKIKGLSGSFLLSPNGKSIAFVKTEEEDKIYFFDTETGKVEYSISNVLEGVYAFNGLGSFSQDGTILAMKYLETESERPTVRLFNVKTGSWIALKDFADESRYYGNNAALSNDTFAIIDGKSVRFWDIRNGDVKVIKGLKTVIDEIEARGENWSFTTIRFGSDGKVLALAYLLVQSPKVIRGIRLFNYDSHKSSITDRASIEMKDDAQLHLLSDKMVTALNLANHSETILFDNFTGNEIQKFGNYEEPRAFSPDDKILAVPTANGIQLWKKSTALQDAFEKERRVEKFRLRKWEPVVEPVDNAVEMHVSQTVEQSTKAPDIDMDQPD